MKLKMYKFCSILLAIFMLIGLSSYKINANELENSPSQVSNHETDGQIRIENEANDQINEDNIEVNNEGVEIQNNEEIKIVTDKEKIENQPNQQEVDTTVEGSESKTTVDNTEIEENKQEQEIIKEENLDNNLVDKELKKPKENKINEEKNIEDLNDYLKNLSSKELSKALKNLSEEEIYSYYKNVKGYSDLQISGKVPIINRNGNTFYLSNNRLNPHMVTPNEGKKIESILKGNKLKLDKSLSSDMLKENLNVEIESNLDEGQEVSFMRDETSKHYKMVDGTYKAVLSPVPIHYYDGESFKDIDTNIKQSSNETFEYTNVENSFITFFNSANSLDNGVFSKYVKANKEGSKRQLEFMVNGANPTHEEVTENKIKYYNVFPNVDMEYQINQVRLKENIYIHEPVSELNYEFLLRAEGVEPRTNSELDIEFIDKQTGEILWMLQRPYAEDSGVNQLITKDMHYGVENVVVNGVEMIKLTLVMDDPNFLNDATYPIVIDPSIIPSVSNIRMIIEGSSSGYGLENGVHMYGFPHGSSGDEYRVYMNFNLSSMPSSSVVEVGQLLIFSQGELVNNNSTYYKCRRVTSNFNNATWYNQPTVSSVNELRMPSKPSDTKAFLIHNLLNDAIRDGHFYGVEITGERSSGSGFYTFVDKHPQLVVSYRVNTQPQIYFCNLPDYHVIKKGVTSYAVQIGITDDSPSDELTTDLYIDGVKKYTKTGMAPLFVVDYTNIPDGIRTLKFVVSDGVYTAEKIVPIKVDRHSPVINNVQIDSHETSVDVSVTATDEGYAMPSSPYSFGIDGNMNAYSNSNSTTFSGLQPSSTHTISIKVQDASNQVTEDSRVITTKAEVPIVSASDIKSDEMTINVSDNNASTEYLIQVDDQFVASNGTLTSSQVWIDLGSQKLIKITSLETGKAYTIKAKARNTQNEETQFSAPITASTIGEVPAIVQNLIFDIQNTTIVFNWDAITDATKYDIEINSNITQVTSNQYILDNVQLDTTYKVRVRGVNDNGNGQWCDYIEFIPETIISIQTTVGEEYYLTWNSMEKTSLNGSGYTLLYNAEEFELVDLCAATFQKEKTVGNINGSVSPISIEKVNPGEIQFTVDRTNYDNQHYTAAFNTIVLKALKSQKSIIQFKVTDTQ